MQISDRELVENIRKGDLQYFRMFYDNYYINLCKYAYTILKDRDEAQDIVQNIFLKLWEKRELLEIRQTVQTYVYKSVYNNCMNRLDQRKVRQNYINRRKHRLLVDEQPPEVFPMELEKVIIDAINELPDQCRKIFMMSRYEEFKYMEIAEKLDISVNTVENQMSKALKILRIKLKDILT